MAFSLHPRLEADTTWLGDLPLCRVLLSKEDIGPWLILVPKVEGITEIHHLSEEDQIQFIKESSALASKLEHFSHPDKINIGALGNMVSQLHIHHIARFQTDVAWPGPIWGNTKGVIREVSLQEETAANWQQHLATIEGFVSA
ncbi:HIT family protein [Enterovibrio sp. ZSDZ35]|uniref:HIT family protein n=1 Tax=Enterovibrio qingdaonensis TaxID=2899818 RepID=A0ABT5QR78_9GAMM|nr:HIT family protein [Enterovibrio sp. ZSDZ35]MDD1783015.1 HIT family protein [Enterovibrio sp. ZSDZ35]